MDVSRWKQHWGRVNLTKRRAVGEDIRAESHQRFRCPHYCWILVAHLASGATTIQAARLRRLIPNIRWTHVSLKVLLCPCPFGFSSLCNFLRNKT